VHAALFHAMKLDANTETNLIFNDFRNIIHYYYHHFIIEKSILQKELLSRIVILLFHSNSFTDCLHSISNKDCTECNILICDTHNLYEIL